MGMEKQDPSYGDVDVEEQSYVPVVVTSDTTVTNATLVLVDSSQGAITVTLGSDLLASGKLVRVLDDAGQAASNTVTVATEGGGTIEPGGASSKTITTDWAQLDLVGNDAAAHWRAVNRNVEQETTRTEETNTERHNTVYDGEIPHFPREAEVGGGYALTALPGIENPIIDNAADPELVRDTDGVAHIFYEDFSSGNTKIGHASGNYLNNLTENRGILDSSIANSFPCVFRAGGTWYMAIGPGYHTATDFPTSWSSATLINELDGISSGEAIWFYHNNRWWHFFDDDTGVTRVFHSDKRSRSEGLDGISGNLTEPSWSPIGYRPQGQPIVRQNYIDHFERSQGNAGTIGVRRISTLTPETVEHTAITRKIAQASQIGNWSNNNIHHISTLLDDFLNPLLVVDGYDGSTYHISGMTFSPIRANAGRKAATTATSYTGDDTSFKRVTLDSDEFARGDIRLGTDAVTVDTSGYYKISGNITFTNITGSGYHIELRVVDGASNPFYRLPVTGQNEDSLQIPPITSYITRTQNVGVSIRVLNATSSDSFDVIGNPQMTWLEVTYDK